MTAKIEALISSPMFWSIAGLFLYNGLAAVVPQLTGTPQVVANGILGILFLYVHPKGTAV